MNGKLKIEFSVDLELSDFIGSSSPCLTTRTPGQLLSLTSHLTFGSGESKTRITSNFMNAINRQSKFYPHLLLDVKVENPNNCFFQFLRITRI